jgi:hypothetical protein
MPLASCLTHLRSIVNIYTTATQPRASIASTNLLFSTKHQTKLDSHAHEKSKYVDITPFHPSLPHLKGCPVVSGALAYNDPETRATLILIHQQAIYFDHLENNLISPMQLALMTSPWTNVLYSYHPNPPMKPTASTFPVKTSKYHYCYMVPSSISPPENLPLMNDTTTALTCTIVK